MYHHTLPIQQVRIISRSKLDKVPTVICARGGVQQVLVMVVVGGAATLTLVLATLLSSQGDTSRSFQEAEYDKTFANSNQTKVRTRKCME